jgi:two-component system chemotaxis response regulator CheY
MALILIIDDSRTMRELLKIHLSAAGHEVLVADDAVAGGHLVVSRAPQLIIVDIDMPYMTGYEFVEALKSDPATRAIPFIFLSANENMPDHGRRFGAAGFLKKPVMADRLLDLVARNVG